MSNPIKCTLCESMISLNRLKHSVCRKCSIVDFYKRLDKHKTSVKMEVLLHYTQWNTHGPFCACCGEIFIDLLTIDHINNNGYLDRKKGLVGKTMYKWLKAQDFPEGYQVLCFNCNWARGRWGYCPHDTVGRKRFSQVRNSRPLNNTIVIRRRQKEEKTIVVKYQTVERFSDIRKRQLSFAFIH